MYGELVAKKKKKKRCNNNNKKIIKKIKKVCGVSITFAFIDSTILKSLEFIC